jgi:hypothetical protein
VTEPEDIDRELLRLEAELRKLESEYNMFFAGQMPRPPWETRGRVEAMIKENDRAYMQSAVDRFRFHTLQARFATFAELWDRGLRAREEGRPGPFSRAKRASAGPSSTDRIVHVTTVSDPLKEIDKVHDLYERLTEVRREAGQEAVPFHKFVNLLREQVAGLRKGGSPEVAIRVALEHGKVRLTARALKGIKTE